MKEFKQYKRKAISEIRPYEVGETLPELVSISDADKKNGSPKAGDMIARNPANHNDQWLIAKDYFDANFEEPPSQDKDSEMVEWNKWMSEYPSKNGLYIVVMRDKKEVWVGYWNDAMRRFEEAVPEFTDRGIDVDYWAELPKFKNRNK